MGIPAIDSAQLTLFAIVFLRVGSILVMIPAIGDRAVPARVKGGIAILVSLLVWPGVRSAVSAPPTLGEPVALAFAVAGEVLIGLVIGFLTRITFAGIQYAGEIIGIQMGFSIVNVIDPTSSAQVSIFAELQYLLALLIYLAIDGHHTLILAIAESFRTIAPFDARLSAPWAQSILLFAKGLFATAIQVSAPVMAALLFTNAGLGMMARAVPQMNIFMFGFPLYIAAGLTVFGLTVPVFIRLVRRSLDLLSVEIQGVLRLL